MSLERSLQGRKLERDFSAGYSRNRRLGQASEIISVGEISCNFLSLNQRRKKIEYNFLGSNMVGHRMVLNSKCPKRVGSFGYSTDFLVRRRSVGSDIDSVRKL